MSKNMCTEDLETAPSSELEWTEAHLQSMLHSYVLNLRLEIQDGGLVLRGIAHTYYAKQLAQHAAMKCSALRVVMNQIEVR
jgi:hypothetical protein